MPVYKDESKKKNKYWFEFEAGKQSDGSRKKIRKKGFSSDKEAAIAMTKAMNEYYEGTYIEPSRVKFIDYLIETWLPAKKSLSKQTREMYTGYINHHVKTSACGNIEMGKLNSMHIQKFIAELREKGLAENSVKKMYSIINTALNNATFQLRIIKENPASFIIDKPQNTKTEIVVWDAESSRKFVNETEGVNRYSFAVKLALVTGMRQGELLGLRWKDVDFSNNTLRITQTLTHDGKTLKIGAKTTSSVRSIAIDEDTKQSLLKQYNLQQLEKRDALSKSKAYKNFDLVICTQKGTPCSPRNLMRVFYSLLDRIDVPRITFHNLRHTHATLLLLAGVHPKIVSERLGHASVKITLDLYSHLLPNMQAEAAEKIGDIFGGHFGGRNTLKQDKLVETI